MRILTAGWIFPVAKPPSRDGAVAIEAGRILAVGRRRDVVAGWTHAPRWDLGEAALLPGLVNCHTHLEMAAIQPRGVVESFVPWVVRLIESRKQTPLDEQARTARRGVATLLSSGTTAVGEVSTTGQSLAPLVRAGLRGVVYREVLGLSPAEAPERLAAAAAEIRAWQATAVDDRLRVGLSPHSPYGLSEALLSACGGLAQRLGIPAAIHVAESPEEVEFVTTGEGPIPRLLYPAVGCTAPPPRHLARSPVAYLAGVGALACRPLLIHAVHVDASDCRRLAHHGARVAHCPRSNGLLSKGAAPVPSLLSHGIPVGLGTDSLASTPDLDLWEEMRAALALHAGRLDPKTVLTMGTLGGARALGIADGVGSLEVGKQADVIAVAATHVRAADPIGSLLAETRGEDVLLTMIDGEVRHNRTEVVTCV